MRMLLLLAHSKLTIDTTNGTKAACRHEQHLAACRQQSLPSAAAEQPAVHAHSQHIA